MQAFSDCLWRRCLCTLGKKIISELVMCVSTRNSTVYSIHTELILTPINILKPNFTSFIHFVWILLQIWEVPSKTVLRTRTLHIIQLRTGACLV